jgi:hypothetical protein
VDMGVLAAAPVLGWGVWPLYFSRAVGGACYGFYTAGYAYIAAISRAEDRSKNFGALGTSPVRSARFARDELSLTRPSVVHQSCRNCDRAGVHGRANSGGVSRRGTHRPESQPSTATTLTVCVCVCVRVGCRVCACACACSV